MAHYQVKPANAIGKVDPVWAKVREEADAIVRAARERGLTLDKPEGFESGSGLGVRGQVAGRRLFARDTDAATLAAVLGDEPVSPPSAWNEDVPSELDAALLAALEREPERRTRSAQELAATLAGVCATERAADMPAAVRAAQAVAQPGDTVLLSPACASLDMFRDYTHRGDEFAAAVRSLAA